jgi:hypothetical protein
VIGLVPRHFHCGNSWPLFETSCLPRNRRVRQRASAPLFFEEGSGMRLLTFRAAGHPKLAERREGSEENRGARNEISGGRNGSAMESLPEISESCRRRCTE